MGAGGSKGQRAKWCPLQMCNMEAGGGGAGDRLEGKKLRENDGRVKKTCFEAASDPASFVFLEGEGPCRTPPLPSAASAEALP